MYVFENLSDCIHQEAYTKNEANSIDQQEF